MSAHHHHEGHGAPPPHRPDDHTHPAPPGGPGHDRHAGHSVAMFRDRFWISLLLTVPILLWGHMLPGLLGIRLPAFPGSRWIAPVLGAAVFLYGGSPFLKGAVGELRDRLPGMMVLIALAISVAFAFSVAVELGYSGMPLWEEVATLVTIMLLGHWLEMRSISRARGALAELARLLPDTAVRLSSPAADSRAEEVPVSELQEGDLLLIRPGARVPADGTVRDGKTSVNEAMITGESRPVPKSSGDRVIAGTVNGEGSLRVEVTGLGERTALAGIMRLVEQAQQSRSRAQALADRAAGWLTAVALGVGAITVTAWLLAGAEAAYAVERLVAVLVIACPHALGLAIPLVVAISTALGAQNGLLVRDRRGLEEARSLDVVVFDKTGTLTLGEHRVVGMRVVEGINEVEALGLAASVERDSEHPIARALLASARERGAQSSAASDFEALPGHGVRGTVSGRALAVGGPRLLERMKATPPAESDAFAHSAEERGQGVIYLIERDRVLATFAVADAVRPESREAVSRLQELGIEVIMLTGDSEAVARGIAQELGIKRVLAKVLPESKAEQIEALRREGRRVAMVGDGVNDAPALLAADVGIAIGAGTQVAVEAGDIVLIRSDPRDVARIVALSRASYRKMVQNLWWATGYNVLAIPLAAGALAFAGVVLSPAVGAILMSVSTIIVAVNAQLLRRARL
jgi:P-type Cu2+ transporter